MKSSIPLLALLIIALAAPLAAQDPAPEDAPPPPVTFDLSFPGGTPHELINAISKASNQPVNIIVPDIGKDLPIPAFDVVNVTTDALLVSLEQNNSLSIEARNGRALITSYSFESVTHHFRRRPHYDDSHSIWIMRVIHIPQKQEPPVIHPVNVAPFLDRYTIDDISTAIHLAWEADTETPSTPTLKYHPETQLLIASGTQSQIALMNKVLESLQSPNPAPPAEKQE